MPTHRFASLCVLTTLVLFSCNNKKSNNTATGNNVSATRYDTVNVLPDEPLNINALNAVYIEGATQHFTAADKKVSVIKARQGLRLTVNPAVLEKEDGSPIDGRIDISVIELTNNDDLFRSNAATVSNGRLLISGGSYFVEMECHGQKLKIKKGNSLPMEFPKLKDKEMELFYGNRASTGNMNWIKASQPLAFSQSVAFNTSRNYTPYNPPYPDNFTAIQYKSKYHLYDSLESKVIFLNKKMTVREMVDLLQKRGVDKNIDTVTFYPPYNNYRDYNFYTYSLKKYRVISCKEIEAEIDTLAKIEKMDDLRQAANQKYRDEWGRINEANSLTGQLQKYYSPTAVTQLGWINCDRFYESPLDTDIQCELPITINQPQIQYFLIYKSFNGLMNGTMERGSNSKYLLPKLPAGEQVMLIAFAKSNGQLFQCKEEFVVQKNKTVQLNFKNITAEEMTRMFGKNVRI